MVSTHDSAPAPVAKPLDAANATDECRHPTVSRVAPISSYRRVGAPERAKVVSIVPKLATRVVPEPSTTRFALADYTLRDSSTPTAGTGLTASRLGTITRSGRDRRVSYNGHPVYLYVGDKKPGDVNGQGVTTFGAAWYVVSLTGQQITRQLTSSPVGTTGGH